MYTPKTSAVRSFVATQIANTPDPIRRSQMDKLVIYAEALDRIVVGGINAAKRNDQRAVAAFRDQFTRKESEFNNTMRILWPEAAAKRNIEQAEREQKKAEHVTGFDYKTGVQHTPAEVALYLITIAITGKQNGEDLKAAEYTIKKYQGSITDAVNGVRRQKLHKAADMLVQMGIVKKEIVPSIHNQISSLKGEKAISDYAAKVYSQVHPVLIGRAKSFQVAQPKA